MQADPTAPLAEIDDEQLLARAARLASGSAEARAAQSAFYHRHVRYLYGVLKRRQGVLERTVGLAVEDLVQETFQRAFQYGGSYRPGDTSDPERKRQRTRAWLGRIAQNLIADALSKTSELSASPMIDQVSCDDIEEEGPPSSPELRAVRQALEELSEREQDVLRVTALYQRVGAENQRLPNDVSAELAKRWGTTNENIRAIRSRAMKKLMSFIAPLRAKEGVT